MVEGGGKHEGDGTGVRESSHLVELRGEVGAAEEGRGGKQMSEGEFTPG